MNFIWGLLLYFVLSFPSLAQAQCVNPLGEMGVIIFNKAHKVMQYCNGDDWIGIWGGGGSGGSMPSCANSEIIQWQNGKWECSDGSGLFEFNETDPKVGTLTNNRWCRSNGSQVICDQNAPLTNYTETDPKIGTLTNGRWCTTNGSVITCTQTAPVLTETDPKVGTLTNARWCRTNGSQIICDQVAPSSGSACAAGSASVAANTILAFNNHCGGMQGAYSHTAFSATCPAATHMEIVQCTGNVPAQSIYGAGPARVVMQCKNGTRTAIHGQGVRAPYCPD